MAVQGLTTIGMTFGYCVETTAGTRPTTGYKLLTLIKKFPDIGSTPDKIESTTYENLKTKSYEPGLSDVDTAEIEFNLTSETLTAWKDLVTASTTAKAAGKATWFEITTPDMPDSFFFSGTPSELPFTGDDVNALRTAKGSITISEVVGYTTKSANS